jgi:myo-inositol-1(or 4)-monophosphatase
VSEAGGIVTGFSGETDYFDTGDVIAASPKVFGQMLGMLSPFA